MTKQQQQAHTERTDSPEKQQFFQKQMVLKKQQHLCKQQFLHFPKSSPLIDPLWFPVTHNFSDFPLNSHLLLWVHAEGGCY